jgi:hypothetical protein
MDGRRCGAIAPLIVGVSYAGCLDVFLRGGKMHGNRLVWRLWLIGSIAWAAYLVWRSDVACPMELIGFDISAGPWCDFQNADPARYYWLLLLRIVSLPTLIAGAIAAVSWIFSGFRRRG